MESSCQSLPAVRRKGLFSKVFCVEYERICNDCTQLVLSKGRATGQLRFPLGGFVPVQEVSSGKEEDLL